MRITVFLVLFFFISCKQEKKQNLPNSKSGSTVEETIITNLKSFPNADLKNLFDNSTYVDYIFHYLPFSVSQNNKSSIVSNLKMISPDKPKQWNNTCKSIGREFFHIGGDIVYEADVYFSEHCQGYIFMKNEKPIFASGMTEAGIAFYGNLLTHAAKIKNQVNEK